MKKILLSLSFVAALAISSYAKDITLIADRDSTIEGTYEAADVEVIRIDFSQFDHITLYAQAFQGVAYKWGGTTESGFDCSGFMKYLFGEFGYELPHSAAAIAKLGTVVSRDELQKGDLVFFQTSRKKLISHVGMVIDNDWEQGPVVIHASSSRGVIAESLNSSKYLSSRYVKAVRLDLEAIRKPTMMY